jgi:pantoate--beta-alanine ligase
MSSSLHTVTTVQDLRRALLPWREKGESVALVPTMGALHKGHMALVEVAKKTAKRTVVSIFVNPMQFGPKEDLAAYPRPMDADKKLLVDAGCDLLFAPDVAEMYPDGSAAKISPGPLGDVLEGAFRPGHFTGVATVVTKLLMQAMPDIAFFGEKDYQQLLVIRRVTRDLNIPAHIVGVPTVRDADGLALSSRNAYLSPDERKRAVALPQTLEAMVTPLRTGVKVDEVLKEGRTRLTSAGFEVDYLELADAATLTPVRALQKPARLLVAARIGKTRLIDNVAVD